MKKFSITLTQMNPTVGDLDGNAAKIIDVWKNADSDLVVFPEMVLCGYPPEDLVLKPTFLEGVRVHIDAYVQASTDLHAAALIGCPWVIDGRTYNVVHLIYKGKIVATQAKHHLPNYGVFDEKRIFASGPLPAPIDFNGRKIGVLICEDMWFADVAAHLKQQGAEILIVPNASPFEIGKHARRIDLAKARTGETGLPLVYVNQIGGQDELVFDGGSFVMDAGGAVVNALALFEEEVSTFSPPLTPAESSPPQAGGIEGGSESIYAALKRGLSDYVRKNGFNGVVLGLSGGVDSALAAAIAADALGPQNVHCVMMPSPFTSQDSLDDAAELAQNLGCPYEIIPIQKAMNAFESTIPDLTGIAHENMQSRIRGLILMALSNSGANAGGKMVLTTGNKSEMATGYATLYGDMNGGFNALKDVYKTQVYALCAWRNAQSPVIPPRILTKAPSAELRADQKDQDSLPPYDILDDILECLIERDMGIAAIAARGHDEAVVTRVYKLLRASEYKRYQAPPGTKITSRAFGRDRRYPMTNGF
ncbi:MAG: NAD+ synthase [Bdellovibrionales bacterium]